MFFHWSMRDSKSPPISRSLLSILAVLNNAVVWMFSTRPPTSNSSSLFSKPLVTVPNAPITIGIIVTCMFHSFFNFLERSRYLVFFSHSFSFTSHSVLSLEFEWQQVSSYLQDFSQHSDHSQRCSSLDGLYSSNNFQVL